MSKSEDKEAEEKRRQRHNKDKPYAVTFFNFPAKRLLHYTCKILEPPYSNPVIIATTDGKGGMQWDLISATGKKHSDYLGIGIGSLFLSETVDGYKEILSKSRTFVMHGSTFETDGFLRHGLDEVKKFFLSGGTVFAVAGSCDGLNETFGCQWKHVSRSSYYPHEHFDCVPTDAVHSLIGSDCNGRLLVPSDIYIGRANLLEVLPGEALYVPRPYEYKRQFIEGTGENIDDSWYDDEKQEILRNKFLEKYPTDHEGLEDVLEVEQQWESYKPMASTPVAVHLAPNGSGSVVRIGDFLEEDTRMRSLLAILMTTDFHERKKEIEEKTRYRGRY